jgi:hypothetical protein
MKLSTLGAAAALILMTTLAACGGKAQFAVQGTITGLNNNGLTLTNAGDTITLPAGATSFAFPHQIAYGTNYSVAIATQPAHQNCGFPSAVAGPTGSAGFTVSISVQIQCAQNAYTLGGQFTGLTPAADGTARTVTLINGSAGGSVVVSSATDGTGNGDFVLGSVADGSAYGVTILTQPAGLTCTLANGSGVMHESLISNLVLACTPS